MCGHLREAASSLVETLRDLHPFEEVRRGFTALHEDGDVIRTKFSLGFEIDIDRSWFLIFFLVFYTINEYQRYNTFYGHTIGIGGHVMEWVALVRLNLHPGGEGSHRHWNAARFAVAATQILYYSLHGEGVDEHEWRTLVRRGLLGAAGEVYSRAGIRPAR